MTNDFPLLLSGTAFAVRLRDGRTTKGIKHSGRARSPQYLASVYRLTFDQASEYNCAAQGDNIIATPSAATSPAAHSGEANSQPKEPMTQALTVQEAQAALDAAIKAEQVAADKEALKTRIHDDTALAHATRTLLDGVQALRLLGATAPTHQVLARFRKELSPLAESYGVKIVLVGDRTSATLTAV